jgi:simple sugar transport system substrate-binding protein
MKKLIGIVLMCSLIGFSQESEAAGGKKPFKDLTIAFVPKVTNQPWFQRMETGVKNWSKDNGVNVIWKGPTENDPAAQVQIITDLVAQGVDILCVVPLDPKSCEPILKKAMDQGIIVVVHEASSQENCNYDVEAFKAHEYGAFIMDNLAKEMGETGKYITMVGAVTMDSHMEWADGGVARQKEKYPNMQLIQGDGRVESQANAEVAYQVAKEMIKKHPDLKGIMGTSSFDAMGCARAIKELGLVGKVFTAGSGIPSENAELLKEGTLKAVTLWDPRDSAYAMLNLTKLIYEGKPIGTGVDLGVDGYHKMVLSGKVLEGQGWITITKDNVDSFGF